MDDITRDGTGDITRDDASDITWMTYAELGEARGISTASAKRLAIRRHWRRHRGNDGTARVAVPVTEITLREAKPGDATGDDTRDVTGVIATLRDAFATALGARDGEIAALKSVIDAKEGQLAAYRGQIDGMRDRLDAAERDAQKTRHELEELRQADEARRAGGRLQRAWRAWRGGQ